MKSYKQQTLDACKELEKKYRNPYGETFFEIECCHLCHIYMKDNYWTISCNGCFMARKTPGKLARDGCDNFKTYIEANCSIKSTVYDKEEPNKEFLARADFFKRMQKKLKKFPTKQFTPSGWRYFKISRNQ